jgi:AcrR family transcriptional regulator
MSTAKFRPPRVPSARPGQAGGKRDENRRRRIEQLCDAAMDLYLVHGIGAVTIDQIVDAAGIAKGSFYRYFDDQAQLVETLLQPLAAAIEETMAHAEQRLGAATRSRELPAIYIAMATEMTRAVAGQPRLLRLYLQECRSPAAGARRPVRELADRIAARGIRLSTIARDFGLLRDSDPRVGALTVIGAVERLSFAALTGEDIGPLDALPGTLVSIVLEGVRQR